MNNVQKAFIRAKKAQQKYLYLDTFSLLRWIEPEKDWETEGSWQTIASDIPCHFSQPDAVIPNQTDTTHVIVTDYKLFFAPEIEALAGDRFVISHEGRIYEMYYGGKPAVYRTHQEQRLTKDREKA